MFQRVEPQLTIPSEAWEPIGELPNEHSRLLATIELNGLFFHAEAIAIKSAPEDEEQVAANPEWQERFGRLYEANGCEGLLKTLRIGDGEYAVFLSPFCD